MYPAIQSTLHNMGFNHQYHQCPIWMLLFRGILVTKQINVPLHFGQIADGKSSILTCKGLSYQQAKDVALNVHCYAFHYLDIE